MGKAVHFTYVELRALLEGMRVLSRSEELKDQLQQTLDVLCVWLGMERGMIPYHRRTEGCAGGRTGPGLPVC